MVVVNNFMMIITIIIIGETLGQVFHCSSQRIVLMASVPLVLLSWIRVRFLHLHIHTLSNTHAEVSSSFLQSFQELSVITVFGVLALYAAIAAIVYDGTVQYLYPHPSSPLIEPDTAAVSDRIPLFVPQTVLTFLGFHYYRYLVLIDSSSRGIVFVVVVGGVLY